MSPARRPKPRDAEARFLIHELFFSTTDHKGIIAFGNDVFVRVSGYARDTLVGAPHNIIRHPDMPRVVFRLLWDYILARKPVAAYVKNLAADGSYYWVLAVVTPIDGGFLSIRLKPSSALFPTVRDLYPELLRIEREAEEQGADRRDAMDLAARHLGQALTSLGFRDYDHLANELLLAEVASRKKAVFGTVSSNTDIRSPSGPIAQHCAALTEQMADLFANVDAFLAIERALSDRLSYVQGLGRALQLLSLNAQLRAAGLRQEGLPLQVVAEQMSASARDISASTDDICRQMHQMTGLPREAAAHVSCSDLSVEMMRTFLAELSSGSAAHGAAHDSADVAHRVAQLAEVVSTNLSATCNLAASVAEQIRTLESRLGLFLKSIRTLEILHVTGKVQAVQCGEGERVSTVFQDVRTKTAEARQRLTELADLAANMTIRLPDRKLLDSTLSALRKPAA